MKALVCDECQRWFHQACGKISNYMFNKINNSPQDAPVTWRCGEFKRKTERVTPRQNQILDDPQAGEISSQLNEAESNNQKLRKLVDVLTRNRAVLSDQLLERANKEIRILNDFLLEKTKLITELSTTIGGNIGLPLFSLIWTLGPLRTLLKPVKGINLLM